MSAAGVAESEARAWPGVAVSSGAFISWTVGASVVAGVSLLVGAGGAGVTSADAGAGDFGGDAAVPVPLVIEPTSGVWPFVIVPLFGVTPVDVSVFTSAGWAGASLLGSVKFT